MKPKNLSASASVAIAALSGVLVLVTWVSAFAGRDTIYLSSSDVVSHTPSEETLGDFYVLNFTPPVGVTASDLEEAYLDFYVDATTSVSLGLLPVPLAKIEVYLLSGAITGDVSAEKLVADTRMVRNVRVGANRRVRLNITRAVKRLLAGGTTNYGLVVGSLTGGRNGHFELKRDAFGVNGDARIVLSRAGY